MDLNANIVPKSFPPGTSTVRPFEFAVRTLLDYDATFLTDRVHSSVFVNGKPTGVYAAVKIEESPRGEWECRQVLERYGPDLERVVVDEFMGLGYRRRVAELEAQVQHLHAHINRIRWWQLRRRLGIWWDSLPTRDEQLDALEYEVR